MKAVLYIGRSWKSAVLEDLLQERARRRVPPMTFVTRTLLVPPPGPRFDGTEEDIAQPAMRAKFDLQQWLGDDTAVYVFARHVP